MTDISFVRETGNVGNEFRTKALQGRAKVQGFRIEDTFWGYIVHGDGSHNLVMVIAQLLAMLTGAFYLALSIAIFSMPKLALDQYGMAWRAGASVVFVILGGYLVWFASRGTVTEIQVDIQKGEVRRALRSRAGRTTVLGRYGLDSIGGVFVVRSKQKEGEASLVLRYRNTAKTLEIARGRPAALQRLKDRIGRDLILSEQNVSIG